MISAFICDIKNIHNLYRGNNEWFRDEVKSKWITVSGSKSVWEIIMSIKSQGPGKHRAWLMLTIEQLETY